MDFFVQSLHGYLSELYKFAIELASRPQLHSEVIISAVPDAMNNMNKAKHKPWMNQSIVKAKQSKAKEKKKQNSYFPK